MSSAGWRQASNRCRSNSRSEEHTSELQSPCNLACRLLLEKNKKSTSGTRAGSDAATATSSNIAAAPDRMAELEIERLSLRFRGLTAPHSRSPTVDTRALSP